MPAASEELVLGFLRNRVVIQNVHHKVLDDGVGWIRIDNNQRGYTPHYEFGFVEAL